MKLLECNNLTKIYSSKKAVDNISLTITGDEIYGLIGVNGAGKTTLLKMILGLISPNSGKITYMKSSNAKKREKLIGAMIEPEAFYPDLDAYNNLKYFRMMFEKDDSNIKEVLKLVGLNDVKKKKFSEYSLGMKQRLGIALALLGKAKLIILDEPLNGLDPIGIVDMRELIVSLHEKYDIAFLISSHNLPELAQVATKYGIVHNGVLLKEIASDELHEICNNGKIVSIKNNFPKDIINRIDDTLLINDKLIVSGSCDIDEVRTKLQDMNIEISSIVDYELSLEDYFRIIIKKGSNKNANDENVKL